MQRSGGRLIGRRAALALLTLGGCATRPEGDWLSGRLTIRVEPHAGQPARSIAAAFDLRGDADSGELRLSSPLGTVLAAARWAGGDARLVTAEGERHFSDLDELARQALGEALPLRALPAWLRGRPWDGAQSRSTDSGFEQLGWQISLVRYAQGYVEAARAAAPAVLVRARIETPA